MENTESLVHNFTEHVGIERMVERWYEGTRAQNSRRSNGTKELVTRLAGGR